MDSGYYAAMTGLLARMQALDTAAENLANAQTPGFRAEREYFRGVLLDEAGMGSQLGQTVNQYGLLGGDRLSMRQGPLEPTGNPLDLAIEGQGFFAIQTQNGVRYTRDGSFHRSQMGMLVTARNEPVLSDGGKPIPVPPGDVSVGAAGDLSIDGGTVARLGVFTFAPAIELAAEGANRYVAPADAKAVLSKDASVHEGAIESANQDAVQGTLNLIVMQRQAEMMQKALTIFHTEFNKFASEDLAKI
jgi:flagellar basal-body rod protein FlgF